MKDYIRESKVRKNFNAVVDVAVAHDLIKKADEFRNKLVVKVNGSERCWAGVRRGKPTIMLSTHDRDCDPNAYWAKFAKRFEKGGIPGKSNWKRCLKLVQQGYAPYIEYAAIQNDPAIGMFVTDGSKPELHLTATACHELAHAIVSWNFRHGPRSSNKPKPHGVEWQHIYRTLRNLTVNRELDQKVLYEDKVAAKPMAKVARPQSGVTARVWEICDRHAKCSRATIIGEIIAEGINPGTAATQYAKWNRARNQ